MRQSKTLIHKCQGFTLLTMMIALATLTILAGLVSNMAVATLNHHQFETADRQDIWVFFEEIQEELKAAEGQVSRPNGVSFNLYDKTVDYMLNGTNIRREVDGSGYEIILQNVRSVSFLVQEQYIAIDIIDIEGRRFQWTIKNMVQ